MDSKFSRSVVSAIIERVRNKKKQILVMTRWKPKKDPVYSGTLEIPAGHVEQFENVYDALKREVREETGLEIIKIYPDIKTKVYSPRDDGAFAFTSYCCQQQIKNGKSWIGFVFICEVEDKEPVPQETEVKDIRWMDYEELKNIFEESPERIFTLQLGVLDFYFKDKSRVPR